MGVGVGVGDAPMLRASARWKPRRSATMKAQAIMIGARLTTVDLVERAASSRSSSKSRVLSSAASSAERSGRNSFVERSAAGARLRRFWGRGGGDLGWGAAGA